MSELAPSEFRKPHSADAGELDVDRPRLPRFRLSQLENIGADSTNLEKLRLTRDTWHRLKDLQPTTLIGATIHGSRIKGTMRPDSDVDITIFTRETEVDRDNENLSPEEASRRLLESILTDQPSLPLSLEGVVGTDNLSEILNSTNDDIVASSYREANIVPISGEIIGKRVSNLVAEATGVYTGPEYIRMLDPAVTLFGLSIDQAIMTYRRHFIHEVRSYGVFGEHAWSKHMQKLELHEEFRRGGRIYLPQTTDSALRYWNLD